VFGRKTRVELPFSVQFCRDCEFAPSAMISTDPQSCTNPEIHRGVSFIGRFIAAGPDVALLAPYDVHSLELEQLQASPGCSAADEGQTIHRQVA
jgi:hypothetical protein